MTGTTAVLVAQTAATLSLGGVAWFVQLVFYPAYVHVDPSAFRRFEANALGRVVRLVSPLMLVEAITSAALLIAPSADLPRKLAAVGFASVAIVWVSTFTIQWPLHRRLAREGWDLSTIRWLIRSQWIRTGAWTIHSGVALAMLASVVR